MAEVDGRGRWRAGLFYIAEVTSTRPTHLPMLSHLDSVERLRGDIAALTSKGVWAGRTLTQGATFRSDQTLNDYNCIRVDGTHICTTESLPDGVCDLRSDGIGAIAAAIGNSAIVQRIKERRRSRSGRSGRFGRSDHPTCEVVETAPNDLVCSSIDAHNEGTIGAVCTERGLPGDAVNWMQLVDLAIASKADGPMYTMNALSHTPVVTTQMACARNESGLHLCSTFLSEGDGEPQLQTDLRGMTCHTVMMQSHPNGDPVWRMEHGLVCADKTEATDFAKTRFEAMVEYPNLNFNSHPRPGR